MPRQPPLSSALLATTVNLIVTGIPGLDQGLALELLKQAARTNASLRQLRDYLQEHPSGLRRPRSDAPLALGRLARLLLKSGYDVGEPGCLDCDRAVVLPHKIPGGRLCRRCYKRRLTDICCRCGRFGQIQARVPEGAICVLCYQRDRRELCANCGRLSRVVTRQPDGQPLCQTCRPNRRHGTCSWRTTAPYTMPNRNRLDMHHVLRTSRSAATRLRPVRTRAPHPGRRDGRASRPVR